MWRICGGLHLFLHCFFRVTMALGARRILRRLGLLGQKGIRKIDPLVTDPSLACVFTAPCPLHQLMGANRDTAVCQPSCGSCLATSPVELCILGLQACWSMLAE